MSKIVGYTPEETAKLLSLPSAETVRSYWRKGEVFQPGVEIYKVGKYIRVDVDKYRERISKEQAQTRQV